MIWYFSWELVMWWEDRVKTWWASGLDQVDAFELGLRSSGFFSQLGHWLAVWLWVSQLHFLCHPFPFVKQTKLKPNLQKCEEGHLPCRIRQEKIWPFTSTFCAHASSLICCDRSRRSSPPYVAFLLYLHLIFGDWKLTLLPSGFNTCNTWT